MGPRSVAAGGRAALRREKRAARRAVAGETRRSAEARIVRYIRHAPVFRRASRIATFNAFDGEPDLSPLASHSCRRRFFVPVIDERKMRFAADEPETRRRRNRFGITEPAHPRFVAASQLDLVLTPLVAFDDAGVRVGVGRGYYDRCFAFLRARQRWRRPKLLGVAFDCQHVAVLEANDWDVPLWGVVTETGLRIFR